MKPEKWIERVRKAVSKNKTGTSKRRVSIVRKYYHLSDRNVENICQSRGLRLLSKHGDWYTIGKRS